MLPLSGFLEEEATGLQSNRDFGMALLPRSVQDAYHGLRYHLVSHWLGLIIAEFAIPGVILVFLGVAAWIVALLDWCGVESFTVQL